MNLSENLLEETVNDLPLRVPIMVQSTTIVRAAVAQMRSRELGCAVIVDSSSRPIGIFTERSLLDVLMEDASLDSTTVGEFTDPHYLQLPSSEPIACVWNAIQLENARFICVTDDEGKLIGVTGQRGLAEYVSDHFPQQVMVQRLATTPWMQTREGA